MGKGYIHRKHPLCWDPGRVGELQSIGNSGLDMASVMRVLVLKLESGPVVQGGCLSGELGKWRALECYTQHSL